LTATPRRRDKLENVFFWNTGPILAKMDSPRAGGQYIQKRWLAPYTKKARLPMAVAINMICKDAKRNMVIVKDAMNAFNAGRKIIIIGDRLGHIDDLYTAIRKRMLDGGGFASVSKYIGGMSQAEYAEAKKAQVIIGTSRMFSEGTDIPDADTLMLVSPMGDIEQTVGRIQRIHPDKKGLIVYDIIDIGMGLFMGMAKKREKILIKLGFTKMK